MCGGAACEQCVLTLCPLLRFSSVQSCLSVDCWTLRCHVGLLEKGTSAILKVRSRIWAETFIEVRASPVLSGIKTKLAPETATESFNVGAPPAHVNLRLLLCCSYSERLPSVFNISLHQFKLVFKLRSNIRAGLCSLEQDHSSLTSPVTRWLVRQLLTRIIINDLCQRRWMA